MSLCNRESFIKRLAGLLLLGSLGVSLTNLPAAERPQAWIGNGPRVRTWQAEAPADRVRLSLREPGIYRVTAAELAAASGWSVEAMQLSITKTNLHLSNEGQAVAWLADGDGLLFYGEPSSSFYAPENVYWVERKAGVAMSSQSSTTPAFYPDPWFVDRVKFQGTNNLIRLIYSTLTDIPYVSFSGPEFSAIDPWNVDPEQGIISESLALPNCAGGLWVGALTVYLHSFHDPGNPLHVAEISLGGAVLGTNTWYGERAVAPTFPFTSQNVAAGGRLDIVVKNVTPIGSYIDYSRFALGAFEVEYRRLSKAENDALQRSGGSVIVENFTTNDVVALDITSSRTPLLTTSVTTSYSALDGRWQAAFNAGGSGNTFQLSSRSRGTLAPSLRGVRDIDWSSPEQAATHVIVIPPEAWRDDFRAAMQPLADYRNSQGLRSVIVDIEDIYNSFSHGLATPFAIRDFCGALHPNGLKYLLLAGDGPLDYKHQRLSVNDYKSCLIPTVAVPHAYYGGQGMVANNDMALGDYNQDRLLDVVVGRLPSNSMTDLSTSVSKTIDYEKRRLWRGPVALAPDWDNTGGQYYAFHAATDRLLPLLQGNGVPYTKHYVNYKGHAPLVRTASLLPALQRGAGMFYFIGHSGEQSLGDSGNKLLSHTQIVPTSWQKPTIAVILGCRINRWHSLTATQLLIPYGVFKKSSGFVAGLGSTGYISGSEAEEYGVSLFATLQRGNRQRLGDVILQASREQGQKIAANYLFGLGLIGDPALLISDTQRGTVIAVE